MNRLSHFLIILFMLSLTGCMRYQPHYRPLVSTINAPSSHALAKQAELCTVNAESAEAFSICLEQYEMVVDKDPANYDALIALGNLYLLWGDGYLTSKNAKADAFHQAMYSCEQAMYLNERFRARVNDGASAWQAVDTLTKREVDALVFWATAVFYYYKECLGPIGQMLNYPWILRARTMLERAEALDPEWGGGIISLSWGFYYLSLPEAVGGDREKSAYYFKKAIAIGPNRPINYWARAKYYHVKMNNKSGFLSDLQRVIHQDPKRAEGHKAWNRFFIVDAKRLLADADQIFADEGIER